MITKHFIDIVYYRVFLMVSPSNKLVILSVIKSDLINNRHRLKTSFGTISILFLYPFVRMRYCIVYLCFLFDISGSINPIIQLSPITCVCFSPTHHPHRFSSTILPVGAMISFIGFYIISCVDFIVRLQEENYII